VGVGPQAVSKVIMTRESKMRFIGLSEIYGI